VQGLGERRAPFSAEVVQAMGAAVGLDIDAERAPVVQTFLTELLDLAATLDDLELDGIEPDNGDPRAGW
jgi:hypothetical protein